MLHLLDNIEVCTIEILHIIVLVNILISEFKKILKSEEFIGFKF